jgi:hypothetical protein
LSPCVSSHTWCIAIASRTRVACVGFISFLLHVKLHVYGKNKMLEASYFDLSQI